MYLTVILREVDYGDDQKTDGGIVYKQKLNEKLQIGERVKKTELTGRSPLRRERRRRRRRRRKRRRKRRRRSVK